MAKKATATGPRRALDTDCRVVLLIGSDAFIAAGHTQTLKEKLQAEHGEIDVLEFDGLSANLAEVLDECRSFGLMQQHKVVVVDNADQFVKDNEEDKQSRRQLVERYVRDPSEGATLVLRSTKWHKGKLDDMIAEVGTIISCDEVEEAAAINWAIKRTEKRHQATIDQRAARALVERVGTDLGRIDCELAKLAVAGDRPGTITEELVARFVGRSREEEVWDIQSTLVSGDVARSVAHVRDLIQISQQPTVMIFWAMTDLARKLHGAARGIRAGANPYALIGALRLFGPSKDIILRTAGRIDPLKAADLLDECVKADVRQKTGLGEPERSAEILAMKFAEVCAV